MGLHFTAVFRRVTEGYIALIGEFPGANTRGAILEETRTNLREAVALVVEANRTFALENAPGGEVNPRAAQSHGVRRRDLLRHLEQHGCEFLREGGNHTVYINRTAKKSSTPQSAEWLTPNTVILGRQLIYYCVPGERHGLVAMTNRAATRTGLAPQAETAQEDV